MSVGELGAFSGSGVVGVGLWLLGVWLILFCVLGWLDGEWWGLVVKLFRLEEWFIVALWGCFDLALPLVLGELVVVLSLVFWCDWFTLLICFGFCSLWWLTLFFWWQRLWLWLFTVVVVVA